MKQRFTVTVTRREAKSRVIDTRGIRIHQTSYEDLPPTTEVVEVEVNLERIAQSLGPKACRSKGKRAQAMSGLVVVRKV